ncbi:hypothetical protein ACOMHN_002874 [Nucella lapillus]
MLSAQEKTTGNGFPETVELTPLEGVYDVLEATRKKKLGVNMVLSLVAGSLPLSSNLQELCSQSAHRNGGENKEQVVALAQQMNSQWTGGKQSGRR